MNTLHIRTVKDSKVKEFKFNIHRCEHSDGLSLLAEEFYKAHGKQDILFPHYEVEVLGHEALPQEVHCFEGKDGKHFICWPFRTPTKSDAVKLATGWSAVASVAIDTGEDANLLLGKFCPLDKQLRHLEDTAEALGVKVEIMT